MSNRLVVAGIIVLLFMVGIIFIPVIFGSMESEVNLTNNTTHAIYQQTTPIIMSGQTLFWIGAVLVCVLLVAGVLFFRR